MGPGADRSQSLVRPDLGEDSSQPRALALARCFWAWRALSPVRAAIAARLRYDPVPSAPALHAMTSSTRRVEGGSPDWCTRRTYSDRGTAGRALVSPSGSTVGTASPI